MSSPIDNLINIISAAPTAIAIVDTQMCYIAASQKWVEDYGLQGKEILGRSHYELFPEIGEEWKAIHADCLRGNVHKNEQDKFTRLNGTVQWLSWDVRPWMDNKGNIGGMIIYSEDITARMVSSNELKRILELYEETNEVARIGSWEIDIIKEIVFWSSMIKEIHELEIDYVPDKNNMVQFFKDGKNRESIIRLMTEAIELGRAFDEDLEVVTAKGNSLWVRIRGNPQFKEGKCIRVSGTIQDIQALKIQSIQLNDSEEKYKSIIDNSLNAHFLIEPDGYILEANKAALDMFGYTVDELRVLGRSGFVDTSDSNFRKYLKNRKKTGHAKAELIGIRKNGGHFPHEISSITFKDSNGTQRTSVSMADITERKNIENSLREERELLRTLIDNIPLNIFIKDLQSRKTLVNKAEWEYMGAKSADEIIGKDDYELYPKALARISIAEDKEIFSSGKAIINKGTTITWTDGTIRSFLTSKIPLLNDEGKIVGLLGINYDISKIKDAENALFESEQKFRKIFENIQDVFYQTDQGGTVTEISPSIKKHSGYSREEVIGRPVTDFYYDIEDRERLVEILKEKHTVSDFEVRLKTKTGELRYSSVNAQLIFRNGEVVGTEGSMRDVTERKLQEDTLKSLNNALNLLSVQKNKFLSVIAHDLLNPISGSVGLLEVVFTDIDNKSKDELIEYMTMMRKGLLNAHELLEDLMEWAKIQFNSADFSPTLITDLQRQLRNCLKKVEPLADAKQIRILENLAEGIQIRADKYMLDSIIRNLVTNSVKFTNKGGEIKISAKREDNGITFSVADNGIGIALQDIDKLFNNNTGFTSFGTSGEKGTGMGLGLCRNFVEKHGGKIWAESTLGVGSTFYFIIPDQEKLSKDADIS